MTITLRCMTKQVNGDVAYVQFQSTDQPSTSSLMLNQLTVSEAEAYALGSTYSVVMTLVP